MMLYKSIFVRSLTVASENDNRIKDPEVGTIGSDNSSA